MHNFVENKSAKLSMMSLSNISLYKPVLFIIVYKGPCAWSLVNNVVQKMRRWVTNTISLYKLTKVFLLSIYF